MLSKRIFVLVSLLLISFLMVGCGITTPPVTNLAPGITTNPVTEATVGMKYTYDVDATDPDGDALTYSLTTFPGGMAINFQTGVITWTPGTGQVGDHPVTVVVTDGFLSDLQEFTVTVTARDPMTITVVKPPFTVDEPYWFTVTMTANGDSGKLVVARFGVPTSSGSGDIAGTLEMGEESDLIFALTGNTFQTGVFTMGDVTAHFRGTFTKEGIFSTTLKVKTIGGFLLCEKVIEIEVKAKRTIAIRWLEDAIRFNAIDEVTNNWVNDSIPSENELATLILTEGEYHFADANAFYNYYPLLNFVGSAVIDGTGKLIVNATYTSPGSGLPIKEHIDGNVEIIIYGTPVNDVEGTMVGTYTQWSYAQGNETTVHGSYPEATVHEGSGEECWWFIGRTEYIAHGEELF
ncbi:hypothetical protein ES705_11275 [subsurface metagenome]